MPLKLRKIAYKRNMWEFICLILISVLPTVLSDCSFVKNCNDCNRSRSSWITPCTWCPLDKKCHEFGSTKNPCSGSIKVPSDCHEENIGGMYNEINAFKNALFSAAAYSKNPEECLQKAYKYREYTVIDTIGQRCELFPFDYHECFAYTAISHTEKLIVLAFRGTSSTKQLIDDIVANGSKRKAAFVSGGKVQEYFKTAHEKLYDCIKHKISKLVNLYSDYNVFVTGHSLGGAMASLAAVRLVYENVTTPDKMSLFTFGMPRVGDKEYAKSHDKLVYQSWRIVHTRDIVSQVPPCSMLNCLSPPDGPFHHGKEVYYYTEQMDISYNKWKTCEINEDAQCSNGANQQCITDIPTCIQYHKIYFGVNICQHCDELSGNYLPVSNRSSSDSYSRRFALDNCEIKNVRDSKVSDSKGNEQDASTNRGYAAAGGGGSFVVIIIITYNCTKKNNKVGVAVIFDSAS